MELYSSTHGSKENKTSVSKTIRKSPLTEAETALGKQKIKYGEK